MGNLSQSSTSCQSIGSHLDVAVHTEVEGLVPFRCVAVRNALSAQSIDRGRGHTQGHVEVRLRNCSE